MLVPHGCHSDLHVMDANGRFPPDRVCLAVVRRLVGDPDIVVGVALPRVTVRRAAELVRPHDLTGGRPAAAERQDPLNQLYPWSSQ